MAYRTKRKNIDLLAKETCLQAAERMTGESPAKHFADQFLTEEEKVKIGRRILIAQAILQGKTRMEINEKLQVSPNTFSGIKKWLNREFTNYHPKKTNSGEIAKEQTKSFTYSDLKRRYPLHFLLFTAAEKIFTK